MAWRSVERLIPSCPASSRWGGRRVTAERSPSLMAVPSLSTVSSNVVGGETGSKTAATASLLSIGQRYPFRAISWESGVLNLTATFSRSGALVVHVGGERSDQHLKPRALVVLGPAQAPPRPLDQVVARAHRQRGARDGVAPVLEDGQRTG